MVFLLDANVLIALMDPVHIQHDSAHDWFAREGRAAWATCPLTENAVLRVVGHASYPNSPGSPSAVAPLLIRLRATPGHHFWVNDISALDAKHLDPERLLTSAQVTDSYLLALARAHGGKLATFDRRLATEAIPDGKAYLCIL